MTVLALTSLLSGCSHTIETSNWVQPVCISHEDVLTDGTKRQILTLDQSLGKKCTKDK
jgi:hypothetical protein